jgi:hypothetical protein
MLAYTGRCHWVKTSNSGTASDSCLRADVAFFVLQAYICALDLRSCCIHRMDSGDGEITQKMCGRCKSLGHHDRRNCATGAKRSALKPRKR